MKVGDSVITIKKEASISGMVEQDSVGVITECLETEYLDGLCLVKLLSDNREVHLFKQNLKLMKEKKQVPKRKLEEWEAAKFNNQCKD